MEKICSFEGCFDYASIKGKCAYHYHQQIKNLVPRLKGQGNVCIFSDCENITDHPKANKCADHKTRCAVEDCTRECTHDPRFCPKHENRHRKNIPLDAPERARSERKIDTYGYVMVRENSGRFKSGWQLEHRQIMETRLGRFLELDENVHHINGVRDDNRIENLELWSTMQPKGQRVQDKVSWAKKILERYSGEDWEELQ